MNPKVFDESGSPAPSGAGRKSLIFEPNSINSRMRNAFRQIKSEIPGNTEYLSGYLPAAISTAQRMIAHAIIE
jgi:hypothetical protein